MAPQIFAFIVSYPSSFGEKGKANSTAKTLNSCVSMSRRDV